MLLHLSEDEEQQVRDFSKLFGEQGFPAQKQKLHISVTFSSAMSNHAVQGAAELLPPVIPASFRREGRIIFGTKRKHAVAWLLETPWELASAAREISALNPDGHGSRWISHFMEGLRLRPEIVPDYMQAIDEQTCSRIRELNAVRAAL